MLDGAPFPFAPIVLPIVVGIGLFWASGRTPALRAHPLRTTAGVFLLLLVLNGLDTPGGDLVAPTIGGIVAVIVCIAFYLGLRRRVSAT